MTLPRRWFRFSLRESLLAVAVICILTGWYADRIARNRYEAKAWGIMYPVYEAIPRVKDGHEFSAVEIKDGVEFTWRVRAQRVRLGDSEEAPPFEP